ncbi:hypothetical protein [Arthrobacter dokdonensis]|uniref:hypothetical protein n=1 Tax=Arthrobacter dokdonellae TaxID=2211210 RepID=UPI000DE5AC5F|nr:hypothetical protein [Arthrobacter dokdonellae]
MSLGPEEPSESALVEVSPGTALVFGQVPEGLDLIPFSLVSPDDQAAIVDAVAATSGILNVGGQVANGLAQAHGLVRLAPETLKALQAGAAPIQSGGYNIGVLAAQNGKFTAQVRWLPATGANAVGVVASLGPAVAMMAIQIQLNEISGLVKQNLALTETVLKTVRREQWAELSGLEEAVTEAVNSANIAGGVIPGVWENIAGKEADLRKQRNLFKGHVRDHTVELAQRKGHQERRQYIEKNGEAILLDLYSLLLAHKSWFEYQALRAGRARLRADEDPREEKLLQTIIDNARGEYDRTLNQMSTLLDTLNRELCILSELPGKWTIPFTGARRSAGDVGRMAQQLLSAVEKLSGTVRPARTPLEQPNTCYVDDAELLDQDLRILRWHLDEDENLVAMATARERGANGVLIAVSQQRVLIADQSDFRKYGIVRRSVQNSQIRYVRFRDDDATGRAEIDLITRDDNITWRFARGADADKSLAGLGALLADRMDIPATERDAMHSQLPPWTTGPKGLTR